MCSFIYAVLINYAVSIHGPFISLMLYQISSVLLFFWMIQMLEIDYILDNVSMLNFIARNYTIFWAQVQLMLTVGCGNPIIYTILA